MSKKDLYWKGDFIEHSHLSKKNLFNAFLCLTVLLPSLFLTSHLFKRDTCPEIYSQNSSPSLQNFWPSFSFLRFWSLEIKDWCSLALLHPILYTNILFFWNISFLFWILGIFQKSFWLIDPYWTLVPPLVGLFYHFHPLVLQNDFLLAGFTLNKGLVLNFLVLIWSLRLTHNYFRRENWKFGQREDWRYTKMSQENPRLWFLLSFFAVGLAQQPMLMGITLPFYSAYFSKTIHPFVDQVSLFTALLGIIIAYFADTQLQNYMTQNQKLQQKNLPTPKILFQGLWKYSRHPNYFGEQLWWTSFAFFAVSAHDFYFVLGTAFNSFILAVVTVMTENKMLQNWKTERKTLYQQYQKHISVLIPLPFNQNKMKQIIDQNQKKSQ